MSFELSKGVCQRLNDSTSDDTEVFNTPATLQVLNIKSIHTDANPPDRHRVILSDGESIIPCMLASQVGDIVSDGTLSKLSIVSVERFTSNHIKETKRIFIALGLQVLGKAEQRIGNPRSGPGDKGSGGDVDMIDASGSKPQKSSSSAPSYPNKPGVSWLPIEGLSPYQNSWGIRARVTQKSEIRQWANTRGDGKLFNVTLMDDSGKIRATAFNNAVDAFYDKFEEKKVYFISKGRVNLAKKKFSNGVDNDYEITLDNKTEVDECLETDDIPVEKYSFTKLGDLESVPANSICDVIAIVKEVGEESEIVTKAGRPLKKRDLSLVDETGFSVRMTLWGRQAEQFRPEDESPLYAFKGVKVGDFGGRSLSMVGSSTMTYNPEIKEAFDLRAWYDGSGHQQSFKVQSRPFGDGAGGSSFSRKDMMSLLAVRSMEDPPDGKPVYFSTRATIMHIKPENLAYPACPTCSKKVIESGGSWHCEKCGVSHPEPNYRYIIQMAVSDYSGQAWLQGFNDVGTVVFGMDANELMKIKDDDESRFNAVLQKSACQTYNFSCRAKQDMYNDQARMRYGINKILPLDYQEESKVLLEQFSQWGL